MSKKFTALSFTLALALAGVMALLWLPVLSKVEGLDGIQVALAQVGTGVIRVATTGSDMPGCGGATPCQTVQYAVDQAQAGEEVRVASGLYTGVQGRPAPAGYSGPTVITQVVYISKTVTIRGGYTTAFTGPPDPETNPTTLDAQGQGRVIFITGDISPTIEGLRITGSDAAGLRGPPWGDDAGGGMYVISATATINNNRVFSNTAEFGGGLYLESSAATFSGNTVGSNTAEGGGGGGLCLYHSDATLSGNTVISNTAYGGGGLGLFNSAPTLSGNTVSGNTADSGGGLYLVASTATLSGNTVISNTATYAYGGGLRLYLSSATLTNDVVADNQASWKGSGLYIRASSSRLLHTTIARNSGGDGSGVHVTDDGWVYSTVALTNTILVSHSVGIEVTAGNTATLESTLWHGNATDWVGAGTIVTGTHNYWGDPRFAADGYHLLAGSAAIDRGVDAGVDTDIDGDPRDSNPDLGADEFAPSPDGNELYLPIIMKGY
jgi:parallel beta-helix repeat protein